MWRAGPTGLGWIVIVLAAAAALLAPASAAQESYVQELSDQILLASVGVDEAGQAISDCNDRFISCLQQPEPYASRIDNATVTLEDVLANLTLMVVPSQYAANHAVLRDGFSELIDGFTLYATGLRETDLDKLDQAGQLISSGKDKVERASVAILGGSTNSLGLVTIALIAAAAIAAAVGVSIFVVVRELRRTQGAQVRDELATCPKCGTVLDRWWTFRRRQIEEWRRDHLASHASDRVPPAAQTPEKRDT